MRRRGLVVDEKYQLVILGDKVDPGYLLVCSSVTFTTDYTPRLETRGRNIIEIIDLLFPSLPFPSLLVSPDLYISLYIKGR